jgi:hypothetical protein
LYSSQPGNLQSTHTKGSELSTGITSLLNPITGNKVFLGGTLGDFTALACVLQGYSKLIYSLRENYQITQITLLKLS